jgi:hypothetical protein
MLPLRCEVMTILPSLQADIALKDRLAGMRSADTVLIS